MAAPAQDSSVHPISPRAQMRHLWRGALIWTVVVVASTAWLLHEQIDRHRQEVRVSAQHRLDSLHRSLHVSFQQLTALPRALARQDSIHTFLRAEHVADSSRIGESDRLRVRDMLTAQPGVRTISQLLKATAGDFGVNEIYLMDRHATIVADSLYDTPINNIGGNRRTRLYYTHALEQGQSLQFLVGRTTHLPGFYFAARVGGEGAPEGMVVVKQTPEAMTPLFDDAKRRLFVTDANGVVVMGNQRGDLLARAPVQGARQHSDQTLHMLYRLVPRELPWQLDSMTLAQNSVRTAEIDGVRHMVLSRPLEHGHLTAWVLVPIQGESPLLVGWSVAGGLALIAGYWLLAALAQRARRLTALTEARQELEHLAHALPLTVFRYHQPLSGAGRFTFVGQGVHKLLGLTEDELRMDPARAWRQAGLQGLQPPTEGCEYPIEQGHVRRWIRCESTPTVHADGSSTYNGYWQDITARHQADARTEAVFNHAPVGFLFCREDLTVIRCNPALVQQFGAPSEQALLGLHPNLPPMTPVTPHTDALQRNLLPIIQDKVRRQEPYTFEWTHARLDGTPFEAEVMVVPFEYDGQTQLCAIIQDISQRKAAALAMAQAQQAAEAGTQAKSRFLANMSHEIRTPMNAVIGMTHLALLDDLPPKARNYVDKAHRAAGNLLQILNDILDVSKIESGKLTLEETEFQLETVINQMADVLGVRAEEKQLELLFTAGPDIPTALRGDPTRLSQVLINLGTNAIKFTQRGEIIVGCEVQQRDADAVTLHFWVKDTGIGMSPEQLAKVFEPFTQGDNSTTRQFGGTGLGLSISKQLVAMMGGQIWADSQIGQGSTLHFTVRMGLQTSPGVTRRALAAHELRGRRLLLVDDNPAARDILGEMARHMGLDVTLASSGDDALAQMQAAMAAGRPHDILLTDWKMPGMDGIAFARTALSMPPEHRPCVLLVTAFARDEAQRAAHGVGLSGILNKPVTPSTLLDSVSQALGQELVLPATPSHSGQVLQQAQRQLAGARILLVEDQAMNQELACDLLQRAGLSVVTANDGQEALEALRTQGHFDGVLMDCQMPVMDGYTATEHIRREEAWRDLPVIAMTAGAMASDRERVLACGMNDHITKPLDLPQMFSIMARWIHPSRPLAPASPTPLETSPLHGCTTLDTSDGLSRCMGNLDLYKRLLRGFDKTQAELPDQIDQTLQAQHPDQAWQHAHSLKGLAGNIGAHALAEACLAMEHLCQQADTDPAALQAAADRVRSELEAVRHDIRQLHETQDSLAASAGPAASPATLAAWWARLSRLIDDHDAQAPDALRDMLESTPGMQAHARVKALQAALQRYDFDQARLELQAWQAQPTEATPHAPQSP